MNTDLILKIYDYVNSRKLRTNFYDLANSYLFSKNFINSYYIKKINEIILYANKECRFYKNIKMTVYDFQDFAKFKIIDKNIIRNNLSELCAQKYIDNSKITYDSTGGSTGQPVKFAYDDENKDFRWAMIYNNLTWLGYKLGDCHGFVYGSRFDAKKQYSLRQKLQNFMMNSFQVNAFFLNDNELLKFAKKCMKRKPKFLIGYSTALFAFAMFVQKNELPITFDYLESTSEPLTEEIRQKLKDVFMCDTYDRYGCREVGNIAHECTKKNGMHINWQSVYVEVINKGKYPFLGKDYGDLVITSLKNKAMPLIRYCVGDIARIEYDKCLCGLESPRIFLAGTREGDLLNSSDGSLISPPALTLTYKDLDGINAIQFIQEIDDSLVLNLVKDSNYTQDVEIVLIERLHKIFGENITISISYKKEIEREPSGKYRFTKRKLKY